MAANPTLLQTALAGRVGKKTRAFAQLLVGSHGPYAPAFENLILASYTERVA